MVLSRQEGGLGSFARRQELGGVVGFRFVLEAELMALLMALSMGSRRDEFGLVTACLCVYTWKASAIFGT